MDVRTTQRSALGKLTPSARSIQAFSLVILLALVVVVAILDFSPWPLLATVLFLLTLTVAQTTSWSLAIAASLLIGFASLAILLQLTPWIGSSLEVNAVAAFAVAGVALIVGLATRTRITFPSGASIFMAIPALAIPIIFLALTTVQGLLGNLGYSWAMQNDATWNLVVSRFVIGDGGIDPSLHANPSPLAPILIAVSAAIGRSSVLPAALLTHDASRAAELWVILGASGAALAGVIAVNATKNSHPALRWMAGLATSCIPLAWFTFGYSLEFGFYNASIALVILLAAWIAWRELPHSPVASITALLIALIAALASWGPLVIIVVALLVVATGSLLRDRFSFPSFSSALAPIMAAALALAYGLFVTLPDLRRDGAALSSNGGIFPLTFGQAVLIVAITSGIVLFYAASRGDANLLVGMLALLAGGGLGGLLLVMQRSDGTNFWGYYPVKFTWMLISLLFVTATSVVFAAVGQLRTKPWTSLGLLAVGAGAILALAWQMPPRYFPSVKNLFPPANILTETGVARLDPAARTLFDITTDNQPAIAFLLSAPEQDKFMNSWLLQLENKTSADPVRYWAYYLDPQNESELCEALIAWDTEVVIHTSDTGLGDRVLESCTGAEFSIALESPR